MPGGSRRARLRDGNLLLTSGGIAAVKPKDLTFDELRRDCGADEQGSVGRGD